MVKFTDPTYPDLYFVVIDDAIYTLEKSKLIDFLEALENNDTSEINNYNFNLKSLDSEEGHFRTIFEKLDTPYIRLLFHE